MRNRQLIVVGSVAVLVLIGATAARAYAGQADLAAVRSATAAYHSVEAAMAAGYQLVPGLDYCFKNPGVGAMGFHYIRAASLDNDLDPLRPEAMVYAPGPDDLLMLGAVEYIVPAAGWDAVHTELPTVLGHDLHLNPALGVYVLHAWIWRDNPSGIFEDWDPRVSCP